MLRNYLKIALRNLRKRVLFVFINILGMGFAVALCIVAYLNWEFRNNWDKDQTNSKEIYRVQFRVYSRGDRTLPSQSTLNAFSNAAVAPPSTRSTEHASQVQAAENWLWRIERAKSS